MLGVNCSNLNIFSSAGKELVDVESVGEFAQRLTAGRERLQRQVLFTVELKAGCVKWR